jgi:hypothetical protein
MTTKHKHVLFLVLKPSMSVFLLLTFLLAIIVPVLPAKGHSTQLHSESVKKDTHHNEAHHVAYTDIAWKAPHHEHYHAHPDHIEPEEKEMDMHTLEEEVLERGKRIILTNNDARQKSQRLLRFYL